MSRSLGKLVSRLQGGSEGLHQDRNSEAGLSLRVPEKKIGTMLSDVCRLASKVDTAFSNFLDGHCMSMHMCTGCSVLLMRCRIFASRSAC